MIEALTAAWASSIPLVTHIPVRLALSPRLSLYERLHLAHLVLHKAGLLTSDMLDGHNHIAGIRGVPASRHTTAHSLDQDPDVILPSVASAIRVLGIRLPLSKMAAYPLKRQSRAEGDDLGDDKRPLVGQRVGR